MYKIGEPIEFWRYVHDQMIDNTHTKIILIYLTPESIL